MSLIIMQKPCCHVVIIQHFQDKRLLRNCHQVTDAWIAFPHIGGRLAHCFISFIPMHARALIHIMKSLCELLSTIQIGQILFMRQLQLHCRSPIDCGIVGENSTKDYCLEQLLTLSAHTKRVRAIFLFFSYTFVYELLLTTFFFHSRFRPYHHVPLVRVI